jgi:hypothetical protein
MTKRLSASVSGSPAAARAFILTYRIEARERRLTIGAWPDWSVTAAREEAKRLKREIDQGRDPMAERDEARESPNVRQLIDRYLEEHAAKLAKRNRDDQASMLRKLAARQAPLPKRRKPARPNSNPRRRLPMPKTVCSKRALPLLMIAALSLTACATAPSRPSVVCPSVMAYDRVFQARLADEIQRLPPGAALEQAMLDYAKLRGQARACAHQTSASQPQSRAINAIGSAGVKKFP